MVNGQRNDGGNTSTAVTGWTWRRLVGGALVALAAGVAAGCASGRTVWLPSGDDDPPEWLVDALESPPPGTLLGVGESVRSERAAREAAMADIDRQILQMLPYQELESDEVRVRRDEVLEVWRRMQRSSSAAFGSRWGSVLHQACRREDAQDGRTPPVWTYYIQVKFDRDALAEIVRRLEERAARRRARRREAVRRYRERVERVAEAARSALRKGRYRDGLLAISQLSEVAVPEELDGEPSPAVLAEGVLRDFLDSLEVRLERRWRHSTCSFEVLGRVRDGHGAPVVGLPLAAMVSDGKAELEEARLVTDGLGRFRVTAYPEADRPLQLVVAVDAPRWRFGEGSGDGEDPDEEHLLGDATEVARTQLRPPAGKDPVVELRVTQDWEWQGMLVWRRPRLRSAVVHLGVRNPGEAPLHVTAVVRTLQDAGGYPVQCSGRGALLLETEIPPGQRARRVVPARWLPGCVNRRLEGKASRRTIAFELIVRVRAEGPCPWMHYQDKVVAVLVPPAEG